MPIGGTQSSFYPVVVEQGRILDVDPDRWSCTIGSFFTNTVGVMDVPLMSPYLGLDGEGIYVMPEVGTVCWICRPSDKVKPFILGFAPPGDVAPLAEEDGEDGEEAAPPMSFANNRPEANPGDIFLLGKDRNFLFLRRGGILQIGATPLAQRMYIPVGNMVRDLAQSYELATIPGELKWELDSPEDHSDGGAPCRFRLNAKRYASDEFPIATLTVGEHRGGSKLLDLSLYTESGGERAVRIEISAEGDFAYFLKRDYSLTCRKWGVIAAEEVSLAAPTASIVSPDLALLPQETADCGFRIAGNVCAEKWLSKTLEARTVILGAGPLPADPAVRGTSLLTWLAGTGVFSPAALAAFPLAVLSPTVYVK